MRLCAFSSAESEKRGLQPTYTLSNNSMLKLHIQIHSYRFLKCYYIIHTYKFNQIYLTSPLLLFHWSLKLLYFFLLAIINVTQRMYTALNKWIFLLLKSDTRKISLTKKNINAKSLKVKSSCHRLCHQICNHKDIYILQHSKYKLDISWVTRYN